MFQSFSHRSTMHHSGALLWTIVDDDFVEEILVNGSLYADIIRIYEQSGLPIVPNIIRAIYVGARSSQAKVQEILNNCKRQHSLGIYQQELDKYMVLL